MTTKNPNSHRPLRKGPIAKAAREQMKVQINDQNQITISNAMN